MIKLFFRNKLMEIANVIYGLWIMGPLEKMLIVYISILAPSTVIVYKLFGEAARQTPFFEAAFISGIYATFAIWLGFLVCVILVQLFKWIKNNIEKARKGIIVKPEWKE